MVYKDSAGKEIHEGDSLMDLTPGFVGEISEVFLDEDEGELADERYEDVQRLIETIRYNTGTLEQLRREYSMMRKDSQSTR